MANKLIVAPAPHVHGSESTQKIMRDVLLALTPALVFSVVAFGWSALAVTCISVASCVLFEYLIQKFLLKGPCTVSDLSAVVTGVLLAFNLPASLPWWIVVIGAFVAIAIGTSHGAYKFKPEQCTVNEQGILVPPPLRFDVLKEVSKRLPGFPIVLHGSSSVPQEYVKMINEHGGKMPNAIGVPEDQLREAAKLSVCKINIDSDLRLAMTGTIRQFFNEHPDKFDPREYLKPARANIKELVRHKLVDVLGCAGKA